MNSFQLLSHVCSMWLTETEQTQLAARDAEALLQAVNAATRSVWAAMPMHVRVRPLSVRFYEPVTTSVTVTHGQEALIPVSVSSASLDGCSVEISGDAVIHTLYQKSATEYSTFHPYMGPVVGSSAQVKIFRDAYWFPYQLERFTKPLVNITDNITWTALVSEAQLVGNCYHIETRRGYSGTRTVIMIPRTETLTIFSAEAIIRPTELQLEDSQTASDLPYENDIAMWIAQASGFHLRTHTKFRAEMATLAATSEKEALAAIEMTVNGPPIPIENTIGPPAGW